MGSVTARALIPAVLIVHLHAAGVASGEVILHTSTEDEEFFDAEEGPDTPTGLRSPSQRRSSGTGQGSDSSFGVAGGSGMRRSGSGPVVGGGAQGTGAAGGGDGAGGTELVRLSFVRYNPLSSR
jgi:hypothetical protein